MVYNDKMTNLIRQNTIFNDYFIFTYVKYYNSVIYNYLKS